MSGNGEQMVSEIVANLEEAWNAGGGAGFAQPFAKDADFVNIRAEHLRSREVIAPGTPGDLRYQLKDDRTSQGSLRKCRNITLRSWQTGSIVAAINSNVWRT